MDQGPNGCGQEGIYQGIPNAEKHVIRGAAHSNVFDATEEYSRVVIDFPRHGRATSGLAVGGEAASA